MSRGLKIILMSVAVVITIGLITYGISEYRSATKAVGANDQALTDATVEWGTADLQSLASSDKTGAEVLNAIRKYKSEYAVKVVTNLSGESGKTYTAADAVVNDEESVNYVKPQALFHCDLVTNANGVITTIVFTENVDAIVEDNSITTPDEAKQYLVNQLSGVISMSDSWSDIAKTFKSSNDQNAKKVLAGAVDSSLSDSWYDLANKSATRISELEGQVALLNDNTSTQHVAGSLSGGESRALGFKPSLIVVWDSHNNTQVYRDSVWMTRNTGTNFESVWCLVGTTSTESTLINNSAETLQFEAYSY